MVISGLNRTAFDLAVYASQGRSPAPTQDSLPAAGPALPDGIGYPQGSDKRFHIYMILLFRATCARTLLATVNDFDTIPGTDPMNDRIGCIMIMHGNEDLVNFLNRDRRPAAY